MLPNNPLTPPPTNDEGPSMLDSGDSHGVTTATSVSNLNYAQDQFATPASNDSTGIYGSDEKVKEDHRPGSLYESDEDQYMGDEYDAHAEALNAEMDALDAEIMGPGNHQALWMGAYGYDSHFYDFDDNIPDEAENPFAFMTTAPGPEDTNMQGNAGSSNLPTSLSAVSLQLQHIQDGQEHTEMAGAGDELHGNFSDNSIPSILIPVYSHMSADQSLMGPGPQMAYVSMSAVSTSEDPSSPTIEAPHLLPAQDGPHMVVFEDEIPPQMQLLPNSLADMWGDNMSDADDLEVDDHSNFSVRHFLERWSQFARDPKRKSEAAPSMEAIERQRQFNAKPMYAPELEGDLCDIQRINWKELGVSRLSAQVMRRETYKNYTNLNQRRGWMPRMLGSHLDVQNNSFKFRKMDFNHSIHLSHFQLRNLLACPTRDHIFYAGRSRVMQWDPTVHRERPGRTRPSMALDLMDPVVQPSNAPYGVGIQISTMTVAHNILVAGGFYGEYALINLRGEKGHKHTEGLIIDHNNSITNHVQVHLPRNSSLPQAVFASNDTGVRILDISSNKFIAAHVYPHAMNCSSISPDQRLRVLVGDTQNALICDADSGKILQELEGHRDYGFACDWADDGWTVATGNQDKAVKIWDARNWRRPVATIAAEMAGVRKLKFSPLGSGKRVLLAAEPADFISVIDCSDFQSKQTLNFFGEIAGVDFTNDGQDRFVANCDEFRGGLMEFERCGLGDYGFHDVPTPTEQDEDPQPMRFFRGKNPLKGGRGYDWVSDNEELIRHPKARGNTELRERRAAYLATNMGFF